MFSDEDKLNNQEISEVIKRLIKRTKGNINIDKHSRFYENLQEIASELGYIEKPKHNQLILSYNDTIKCVEEVWRYVIEGILAPGSSSSGFNFFFPYLHLTERGKKVIDEW